MQPKLNLIPADHVRLAPPDGIPQNFSALIEHKIAFYTFYRRAMT
jgi:hypothetical protein